MGARISWMGAVISYVDRTHPLDSHAHWAVTRSRPADACGHHAWYPCASATCA